MLKNNVLKHVEQYKNNRFYSLRMKNIHVLLQLLNVHFNPF